MEYILYFLIVTLGLIIFSLVSERNMKKALAKRLIDEWELSPILTIQLKKWNQLRHTILPRGMTIWI